MATPLVTVAWGGADNPRGAWSANDAASWATVNLPTFSNGSGASWSGLAYSPTLGMFVAIASGGDNNNNAVARSTDNGHSWTGTAVPNPNSWTMNGICWAGTLALFVIVTSAGPTSSTRVLTSPDGINWTARTLPVTGVALNSVCWASDLGLLVAVGDNNAVYTSPDAVTWSQRTGPTNSKNWRFIVWAGGAIQKFCMIAGNAGGNNDYAYCSDPTSAAWSQKDLTGSAYDWQAIAYSSGLEMLMVVGGNTGVTARSTDGVNYTQVSSGLGDTRFDQACWSDAGLWILIGANTLYTSPNGVSWTAGTPPSTLSWHRMAAANALPAAGIPPLELTAALAEDAIFDAAITIILPPLELAAAFADDAMLAPTIGIWPPLHLAADLSDEAALAVYLTIGVAALRLAADFTDDAVLTARATLLAAMALSVAFTDDADLAAPVTIGFQPGAPPIQVVVVLSW